MAFDAGPIASALPPPCGTAPQHLLFAPPAPDQTAFLPHHIQDAGDGVVLELDIFSQLPGRDFLEVNPNTGQASAVFQCDIPVGSDLRYYPRGGPPR